MELHGAVALVTGASRGIGRGIALALARHGADVAVNYLGRADAARRVAADIEELGRKALPVHADVGREEDVRAMMRTVLERFGRLDVLVNNAGVDERVGAADVRLVTWDAVIRTNLTGAFLCSREALPILRDQGRGRIVMIASIAGLRGTGTVHYVASKAGMLGLMMALARETAGEGITVNAVAPGLTRSDMLRATFPDAEARVREEVPMGRIGEPDDIGEVVVFLARHDYITGTTVNVSGGRHIAV